MTALDPKANDFVAEKLGLWTRGHECRSLFAGYNLTHGYCDRCGWQPFKTDKHNNPVPTHDIPAPDLLTNPWVLVTALWERALEIRVSYSLRRAH